MTYKCFTSFIVKALRLRSYRVNRTDFLNTYVRLNITRRQFIHVTHNFFLLLQDHAVPTQGTEAVVTIEGEVAHGHAQGQGKPILR